MGKAAENLLTPAEYARRRGCSRNAVSKAIKEGRITLFDGRVNAGLADVEWAQNTRARAGSAPPQSDLAAAAAGVGRDPGGEVGGAADYWTSRARREAAEAELAELKLAEELGSLIRADDVRSAYAKRAAGLREALMQIPSRLAAVVAAEPDQGRCHDVLRDELQQVLASVTAG